MPLTDLQRDDLENDLIDLEEIIERTPTQNTEELKHLCAKKISILTTLWRYTPLRGKKHTCPLDHN